MLVQILAWCGSKGQNATFSEHGHVEYQIKWNHECSNMSARILSLHTPSVKGQNIFFSESGHVVYQIRKERSIDHHARTYSVFTHTPDPWVELKGKK